MTTITKTIATSSFENAFETGLHYERADGQRVEMVLVHLPATTPTFNVATFAISDNPNLEASAHVAMPIEEARRLRDLLISLNLDAK